MQEDNWGEFTFDEPKATARILNLPNSVMERICRFLSKEDKATACLIHPQWTIAAQSSLWEAPRFLLPKSFRNFMERVHESKKNALLVRDIFLLFVDHAITVFEPIAKSHTARHGAMSNALARADYLASLTRQCENCTTFSFYGWNLTSVDIEKLTAYATKLQSIYVVGWSDLQQSVCFTGLFSRLTCLRLDGNFNIDYKWADTLSHRGKHIRQLQLSLQDIDSMTLQRLCAPTGLISLIDLTFTEASCLVDFYVEKIAEGFPKLTRFCLEGTEKLTMISAAQILKYCKGLTSLEILAHPDTLVEDMESTSQFIGIMEKNYMATPSRVLLQNMNINNDQLAAMTSALSQVQTLGFKECPQLTSEGLESAFRSVRYLKTLQLVECINIDSSLFHIISTMDNVTQSLYRVYFEYCGPAVSKDVYELCCSGNEYNLREITIVGYHDLQSSTIGSYNEYRYHDDPSQSVIQLGRTAIDALTNSNDPEFYSLPEDRLLTGKQILLLARNLDMNPKELLNLLDTLHVEESKHLQKKSLSFDPSTVESKSASRLFALKHQHSKERPTTPALWSHDFKENLVSYKEEEEEDSFGGSENDTGTDEDNTDQVTNESESVGIEDRIVFDDTPTDDDDEEEEENESNEGDLSTEETLTNLRDGWAPPLAAPVISTGSEITLGGWGETSADVWHPQTKHHKSTAELPTPARSVVVSPMSSPKAQQQSTPLQSTLQQQSPQHQSEWIGYREEKYQQQWQQSGLEVNAKKVTTKQRANVNHFRNTPQVSDSDGWGVASNSYSWDSTPGYAKDVIEEQKSTLYWIKDSKQDWLPANPPPQTVETTISTSRISKPRTTNPSQPILFSEIASNMNRDTSVGSLITQNHRNNNKGNHTRPEPVQPKRSDSPVSSDGSIPWNEVSNVNIKIRDDDFPPVSVNSVNNNNNDNKFLTPRKDTSSRSKWHSAKEWDNVKESNQTEAATTSSSQKINSWQGNFSPKDLSDTATPDWSKFNTASSRDRDRDRFSRPSRSATRQGSLKLSNTSDSNRNISTPSPPRGRNLSNPGPSQVSQREPPKAAPVMLIDTDNTPAFPSRQVFKSDVWDSLSSLDMVPKSQLLAPQGATTVTKPSPKSTTSTATASDTLDWSLISGEVSNDNDGQVEGDEYCYQPTISGTVTEEELQFEKQAREKDNLVDFDSLFASPFPNSTTPKSDLLDFDESNGAVFDTLKVSTPTIADTPRFMSPVIPPNTTSDSETATYTKTENDEATVKPKKKSTKLRSKVQINDKMYMASFDCNKDTIEDEVRDFCIQHDGISQFEPLLTWANQEIIKKETKRILGKARKKSPSPAITS